MHLLLIDDMITVMVLVTVYISRCDSQNATDSYQYVEEYQNKICNNEPSCHLINQVPKEWTVLPVRNCMCDRDCIRYKDCCEDSEYYNKSVQTQSSVFQCQPDEKVYMITTCPADYPFQYIRWKCERSMNVTGPYEKVYIPVTNVNKKITYGNEYCAVCHNDFTFEVWNLTVHCYRENTTVAVDNAEELGEVRKRIEYDIKTKSLVSLYNNQIYNCRYVRLRPPSVVPYLRNCVAAVSSCADNLQELCGSYTAYVSDENGVIYKNLDCARCNSVTKNLTLCNPPANKIKSGSVSLN